MRQLPKPFVSGAGDGNRTHVRSLGSGPSPAIPQAGLSSEMTSPLCVAGAWERQNSSHLRAVEIDVHEGISDASAELREPKTQPTMR